MKDMAKSAFAFLMAVFMIAGLTASFQTRAVKADETGSAKEEQYYTKLQELADKGTIGLIYEDNRDTLKFGKWENKDIEWDVLEYSADGKSALVMSRYILCSRYYNDKDEYVTWKDCSLRKWLNEDFLKTAFSKSEKKRIKKTKIANEDNKVYGTAGGDATKDKVFLLSGSEYVKYFEDNEKNGYDDRSMGFSLDNKAVSYWLRTPGKEGGEPDFSDRDWIDWEDYEEEDYLNGYAANVYEDGDLFWDGTGVAYEKLGVRPVMWIKLTDKMIKTNGLTVGENKKLSQLYLSFGEYENDNDSEPLQWQILDYNEKNSKLLLISRYLIDMNMYHNTADGITWEECAIRKWLNEDFYATSFNEDETKLIKEVKNKNADNKKSKTIGGNKTKDKIFLLSVSEVKKYFGSVSIDKASPERIARFSDGETEVWWLRSPGTGSEGTKSACAAFVDWNGEVCYYYSTFNYAGIRPALWISLE